MSMQAHTFDRTVEDVGNIVEFGHVNIRVPDQGLATSFYVTGLGLTRDPYLVTGIENMWINAGTTQFHLPTGQPQVLRGTVVLAVPDLENLAQRLARVMPALAGSMFGWSKTAGSIDVMCPWGNRLRCVESETVRLGIVALELDTPSGTVDGIAQFYREVFATPAVVEAGRAVVPCGLHTAMVFCETASAQRDYDGAHVQIALADFSGPHTKLLARGLVTEESSQHQYRFQEIVDPDTGSKLCEVEHEVRSMRHPMFARPLVNRDPDITNNRFAAGREPLVLGVPPV